MVPTLVYLLIFLNSTSFIEFLFLCYCLGFVSSSLARLYRIVMLGLDCMGL